MQWNAIQGDHRRLVQKRSIAIPSDATLMLFAASRPIYDYPLELLLSFKVAQVNATRPSIGGSVVSSIFHPDAEVARDLAALLTLLSRRLITVSGKTQEKHARYPYHEFDHLPFPVTALRRVYWPPLPAVSSPRIRGGVTQQSAAARGRSGRVHPDADGTAECAIRRKHRCQREALCAGSGIDT